MNGELGLQVFYRGNLSLPWVFKSKGRKEVLCGGSRHVDYPFRPCTSGKGLIAIPDVLRKGLGKAGEET